jgi:hypothetical protein
VVWPHRNRVGKTSAGTSRPVAHITGYDVSLEQMIVASECHDRRTIQGGLGQVAPEVRELFTAEIVGSGALPLVGRLAHESRRVAKCHSPQGKYSHKSLKEPDAAVAVAARLPPNSQK